METTPQERHEAFLAGRKAWHTTEEGMDFPIPYDVPELQQAFEDGWAKEQDRYADIFGQMVI